MYCVHESLHKYSSTRLCVCRPEHVCVTLVMCVTRSLSVTFRSISPSSFWDKTASSLWNIWLPTNIRLTHMSCRGRHITPDHMTPVGTRTHTHTT